MWFEDIRQWTMLRGAFKKFATQYDAQMTQAKFYVIIQHNHP